MGLKMAILTLREKAMKIQSLTEKMNVTLRGVLMG